METSYEINDDVKREVLNATDLVALIGASTSLKKMGRSWKGLCPFHGEKTPSFYVHPEKGFYYCFGCGAKGDAITFVRETERLEFPEAVAYLARLSGVTLPVRRGGTRVDRSRETRGSEALAAAARFFRKSLETHASARELLARRKIGTEEVEAYGFGAAPDTWDGLKSELAASYHEEILIETGLLQKSPETGRVYDRFRNRLTIEIRDARGEVVGFGARALGDDSPKYLNSPESTHFVKGRLLYGLDRARDAIRKSESAVLVEGFFDRIALEKCGVEQGVASMGTSLTPFQCDLLARHATTVIVAYDGDAPGRAAARKAFSLLLERGVQVRNLTLTGEHDPDSFLAAEGPEALAAAIAGAESILDVLEGAVASAGESPELRTQQLNEAVAILKSTRDLVLRHEFLAGFAKRVGLPLALLDPTAGKKKPASRVEEGGRPELRALPEGEERVLSILMHEWPQSASLVERVPADLFVHPASRELLEAIKGLDPSTPALDFSFLESHLGEDAGQIVARLLLEEPENSGVTSGSTSGQTESNGSSKRGGAGLGRLHKPLLQLKIRNLEERGATLQREILLPGTAAEPGRFEALLREKQVLHAEIHRLKQELRQPTND